MTSTPESTSALPDAELIGAHDLALAALKEITPEATIGEPVGHRVEEDGVVSLLFANKLHGYPGWFWTVSLARVEDAAPTVLEVELLPGDGALLAPEWVPWAVRLADYHAQQAEARAQQADEADEDFDDEDLDDEGDDFDDEAGELDDVDDLDAVDFDVDGSRHLHSGDVDGVDIDEADPEGGAVDDEADLISDEDDLGAEELSDPEN